MGVRVKDGFKSYHIMLPVEMDAILAQVARKLRMPKSSLVKMIIEEYIRNLLLKEEIINVILQNQKEKGEQKA